MTDPTDKTFPNRLRHARLAAGFSLEGLAKVAPVSKTHLQRWETLGSQQPSADKLFAVAKILHVDAAWLLYGRGLDQIEAAQAATWETYVTGPIGSTATPAELTHQWAGFVRPPGDVRIDLAYLETWLAFMRARLRTSDK